MSDGCKSAQQVNKERTVVESMADLADPSSVETVQAICAPPIGWQIEPLKKSQRHAHQIWMSPTRRTAYGVIHMKLPLPVGENLVLQAYLREMKRSEGEAVLLSEEKDPKLPGLRFVAEGGMYKTRTNLIVDGWQAWAIYAGTVRGQDVMPDELDLAERAREHTRIGLTADK